MTRSAEIAETFRALGDPVRLEMVQRLADNVPTTITVVSRDLGLTRQGARRHLQVLVDANMVNLEPKGRDVYVQLDPAALDRAKSFIAELEMKWDQRLSALQRFIEGEER